MKRNMIKLACFIMVFALAASVLAGCVTRKNETTTENQISDADKSKKIVKLKSIYPGDEPIGMKEVLVELNKRLAEDIGVELELLWAPWDEYYTKVEIGVAAGEQIDYAWNGSPAVVDWTAKKIIQPIDEQLSKYGEPLYKAVDKKLFDTMKIDGKVMGFPSGGNSPISAVDQVITYREDLRKKYNLPLLDTIENMELYFKTIKEKEPGMIPLAAYTPAYRIMRACGPERFLSGTNGAVAYKIIDENTVEVMPILEAESYVKSIEYARKWYLEGYIPSDILNLGYGAFQKVLAGAAAAGDGSAMKAAESQGIISADIPGAMLADQLAAPNDPKYLSGNGGNALYVTSVCQHPDEVVQFWGWVLSSQENYDLYCYGIKGKHYEIKNNRIVYLNSDYSNFPAWMFKNIDFLRFPEGSSDEYIQQIMDWDKGALPNPLMGFVFNPEKVASEMAMFKTVFDQYGSALSCGAVDLDEILPEMKERLKAAGEDKIVEEARRQVNEFLTNRKNKQ